MNWYIRNTCFYFRSFSGIPIGLDTRGTLYGKKIDNDFRAISRGPLLFSPSEASPQPNFNVLEKKFPAFTTEQITEAFESFCKMDTSHDYHLSADEIMQVLKQMNKPLPKRKVYELIREVDVRQSGVLEFDEFLQLLKISEKGSGASNKNTSVASGVCSIQ